MLEIFMVEDTFENRKKCLCPKCPSYPLKGEGEVLYCGLGASKHDIVGKTAGSMKAKGCICPGCPVYHRYDLKELYYCDKEKVGESKSFIRKQRSEEDDNFYQMIMDIKDISALGKHKTCAMGSLKKFPFGFDDLNFVPAQVWKISLNADEKVNTEIIIGPKAKKPLKLFSPIIVSGMSYGAVSKKVRQAISQAAADLKIGFNSGEGGLLEDEIELGAPYMIGQYATGRFGISEEKLKRLAAIEIRFGQGAYPGKGSHLPADKIIEDIAKERNLKKGEDANSPAHHADMITPSQIKEKISYLRDLTGGAPIGAKIGCGNIEKDIEVLVNAEVDFIAIDGFGGGTGATDCYIRENAGIPILAALPRAVKALFKLAVKDKISLIVAGGLRKSADFAKCLALGANAVYIGTAALIAINCEQYRVCHTGLCPTGVTTHKAELTSQLDVKEGARKLMNFIKVSNDEMAEFARIAGKNDVKNLDSNDLVALAKDVSRVTGVKWLDNKIY